MTKKHKPGAGRPQSDWPPDKVAKLRELFPTTDNNLIAAELDITVSAVRNAAIRFKVKKTERYWDKSDEDYVRENWPVMSAQEIATKIGRTKWAVINKYRELAKLR